MKAKWKQIMAVLLIVSLVLGFCPDVAKAEEIAQDLPVQAVVNTEEDTEEASEQTEEKTTEAATEETITETVEEASTEEVAIVSPEEEETADGVGQEQKDSDAQEKPATESVEEQPEGDREGFRQVEKYTLYCMEDTRVYEKADAALAVVEVLTAGEAFVVTAETDTWYQVVYGTEEKQGFVEKKEGSFTKERPEREVAPVEEEEEEMASLLASSNSKMIYSDGSWSGGIIWYVNGSSGGKHYIFCLDHGSTMYTGKYYGEITTGYSGYDAFRIATALNYFKIRNGGYGKKDHYGEVQNAIWNTGSSGLLTYIRHAWKLASNNGSRSAGSASFDSKLKPVGAGSTSSIVKSLKAQKVSASNGVIDKTISLSGSAWKYFAKGEFPGSTVSDVGAGSSGITVAAVYDKDGKAVSYDKESNYVGTDGKLHIKLATDPQTGFGSENNPATILMRVRFPYEGADKFRYLKTPSGKQNLTYDTQADTIGYFAMKVYAKNDKEYSGVSINKEDEFGNPVSGCTFCVKGISGDALANGYEREMVVDSTDDVFEIEDAGTYTIEETAVPDSGEYVRNKNVVTFTAEWKEVDPVTGGRPEPGKGVKKLVLEVPLSDSLGHPGWGVENDNDMNLTYTCINESTEGSAALTKYGNMLVAYRDGKFVYEKKPLEGAEFEFYAAEDIYSGDTLVFQAGTKITDGMGWGKIVLHGGGNLPDTYKHTVNISNSKTGKDGKITISGLPAGDYYAIETKTVEGFEKATARFYFTIVPNQTVPINGTAGIINEVTPAVCHVFKVDADTKEPLDGAEFTLYADVANTDFSGKPLFDASSTVPAVTARNLATGYETVEKGRWVPIQTVTTKEGGMAEFDSLPRGRYLVTETKAPVMEDGSFYGLAEESYIFTHDGESNVSSNGYNFTHTFEDIRIYKGSIRVIKTDGKTKYPLEGVEFNLLDKEKQVIGSYKTDRNGEILMEDLEIGTYYVQETKTLKGYKLMDELVEVVLTPEALNQTVEVENYQNDTSITIRPNTSVNGHGGVKTGDRGLFGMLMGMFLLFSVVAAWFMKKKHKMHGAPDGTGHGRKTKPAGGWNHLVFKKALFVLGIAISGSILLGLSVKAAAEFKEIANRELTDAEHNGKIYTYAVEKQFEVPDEHTDVTAYFDQTVNGMELQDIACETIDMVPGKEIKVLEETKDYKKLTDKDEAKIADTLDVGGETYKLKDITWSEEPNIEHVDYTVVYGYRTEEPEPAKTYEYTYTSPVTKKENTVTLPFVKLEQGDTTWADGFSAIVTLHNLDGGDFTLGTHEFAYNKDSISFSSSDYAELIRMLGYDTSKYRLTSAKWQGKEYKDKEGIRCRDAYVAGQQYAASYRALYEGDVENGTLYTAHATYTLEQEVETGEAESYILKATGYYEKTGVWHNIISFVTEHQAVSVVSAGILLLCVILAMIAVIRKKRNDKKNGDIDTANS
ncbi:MAG: hypothetical protein K2L07_05675 [Lachnospiraceae bacterium]|nr:hypothetical protein [Lachnospiraceae bacterium]